MLTKRMKMLVRVILSILTILLLLTVYLVGIKGWHWLDWTGFGEFTSPSDNYQRAKTLWDWLDLLIVPIALAFGAWILNRAEKRNELILAQQRAELEREIEQERQRQATLDSYFDQMTNLLLEHKLRDSKKDDDEVRVIARVRTYTAIRRLDSDRNRIISFRGADLSGAQLDGARLFELDLRGARLAKASLKYAYISWGSLHEADLSEANLTGALLQHVDLVGTNLNGADLSNANLLGARSSPVFFENAKLNNTLMYDGKKSEEWQSNNRKLEKS